MSNSPAPAVEKPVVSVEVRNVYGKPTIYPANDSANDSAKKVTLDVVDLEIIKSLGFTVEEALVRKLAAF